MGFFRGSSCGRELQRPNIDALFENMLVTADGTYAIDYEWVFYSRFRLVL